jgi:prepilin-type processing-associated H-X9-DG protein
MYRTIPHRVVPRSGQVFGFTLVELLVVVGAIAVLIALLLPTLRRSVQASQQVVCLNNLRQISLATMLYCHDNDGALPGWAQDSPNQSAFDWIYWQAGDPTSPYYDVNRSPVARYMNHPGAKVFRCPADPIESHIVFHGNQAYLYSYCLNRWTSQMKVEAPSSWGWPDPVGFMPVWNLKDVVDPSEIIMYVDEDPRRCYDGTWWNQLNALETHDALSYLHERWHDVDDIQKRGNVAFCDGHGEFVTEGFSRQTEHWYPRRLP